MIPGRPPAAPRAPHRGRRRGGPCHGRAARRAGLGGPRGGARGARDTGAGGKGDRSHAREPADRRRPGPTTPHPGGRGGGEAGPPTPGRGDAAAAPPWGAARPRRRAAHKAQRADRPGTRRQRRKATTSTAARARHAAGGRARARRSGRRRRSHARRRGADRRAGREPPATTGPPGRSHARPVAGRWWPGVCIMRRIHLLVPPIPREAGQPGRVPPRRADPQNGGPQRVEGPGPARCRGFASAAIAARPGGCLVVYRIAPGVDRLRCQRCRPLHSLQIVAG